MPHVSEGYWLMLSDPEQVRNLFTPTGLAMLTDATGYYWKAYGKGRGEEKRENKGSGEKGMGVKEGRGGEKKVQEVVVESHNNSLKDILYQTLPEGVLTQKRLGPCLSVHH